MVKKPQRKSPRLPDYDYSKAGGYFITICTYQKEHHFGHITTGQMVLNEIGQIAHNRWEMIPEFFPSVELNDYVVMPNHIHGILFLNDTHDKQPTIGSIIANYKASVTRIARADFDFTPTLWQSRYHDHIIRNEPDLNRIREYVLTNPARWEADTFYD
jgi:putative transposase